MFKYLRKSINKFAGDVLAKLIYDVVKWAIILIGIALIGLVFPKKNSFGAFIKTDFSISVFTFSLIIILIVIFTLLVSLLIFRKKIYKLQTDNFTDELTGLFNNKALKEKLAFAIQDSKKNNKTLSVILMDIDNFKSFNEIHGYIKADEILKKLGQILKNDSRITDTTFRQHFKGDEFIILASETDLNGAVKAANRKRTLLASTGFTIPDLSETFHLTVCCGVTEFNPNSDSAEQLLERANNAMKMAKAESAKNSTKSII